MFRFFSNWNPSLNVWPTLTFAPNPLFVENRSYFNLFLELALEETLFPQQHSLKSDAQNIIGNVFIS